MNNQQSDDHQLQHAINYASDKLRSTENPKPVLLHSLQVAMLLLKNKAPQTAILSAILHDILEDSDDTTYQDIADNFGETIANIVEASTIEHKKGDYSQRLNSAKKSFHDAAKIGLDALLVRAADLIDNSNYYNECTDAKLTTYTVDKFEYFLEIAETQLENTFIWPLLIDAYTQHVVPLKDS